MARLLADENFPLPVVERLRRIGRDVVTMNDIGRFGLGLSDALVLAEATGEGRALLTLDRRDFRAIHRRGARHAGSSRVPLVRIGIGLPRESTRRLKRRPKSRIN